MKKQKRSKKKKKMIIIIVLLLLVAPLPFGYEDSISSYNSILFSYNTYRILKNDDSYYTKSEFLIFPFNLFK